MSVQRKVSHDASPSQASWSNTFWAKQHYTTNALSTSTLLAPVPLKAFDYQLNNSQSTELPGVW